MSGKDKNTPTGDGYGSRFKAECRSIYLSVRSLAGVQRELKRRGYPQPPSDTTLGRWSAEEGWREELDRRDRIESADLDPKADDLDALYREVKAMRKVAREKIVRTADGKITFVEGGGAQDFHAYNRLAETEAKILESKRRADLMKNQESPVEVIFAAMKRHPDLGKLLNKPEVISELKELIALEMMDIQRRAVENIK